MFCPKCGTENPETGKFCRKCGTHLGNVPAALSGELARPRPAVFLTKKGKPVTWESAIVKIFSGVAFVAVSIALAFSQMGRGWWFWMLIPAFMGIGGGIAQLVQLKKNEQTQKSDASFDSPNQIYSTPAAALSAGQNDYIEPRKSIYETGKLVVQPSVTEGTTRLLEINKEGETITLPEPKS